MTTPDIHASALAVRSLLVLLVKFAMADDTAPKAEWRHAARQAQTDLRAVYPDHLPAAIDRDSQWELAVTEAESDPRVRDEGGVSLSLPRTLPFDAQLLLASPFDLDDLRDRIRGSAATG